MRLKVEVKCKGTDFLPLDQIEIFQGDLKKLSIEDYERLRKSLLRFGIIAPWYIWKKDGHNYVLDGTQRTKALPEMVREGIEVPTHIPVIYVEPKDKQAADEIVLVLSSQYGELTTEALGKYVVERKLVVQEVMQFTRHREVNEQKLVKLVQSPVQLPTGTGGEPPTDEKADDVKDEKEVPPRVQRGEVWVIGDHRIMCGDATNPEDVDKLMQDEKANMIFTDPPYNVGGKSKNHLRGDLRPKSYGELKDAEWDQDFQIESALLQLRRIAGDACSIYICTSQFLIQKIWDGLEEWADHLSYCVWFKLNPMPSMSKRHWTWCTELVAYATSKGHTFNFPPEGHALSCWAIPQTTQNRQHPTQKPVRLVEHALKHSSNPGDIIADLFGGVGTTAVACAGTSRRARVMEINPRYCDVALDRLETLTGLFAEKEDDG